MDTRVITLASQWSNCRGNVTGASAATDIEVSFANGLPLSIAATGEAIQLTIPIDSQAVTQALQSANNAAVCSNTATPDPSQVADSAFSCTFFDPTTQQLSTTGCTSNRVNIAQSTITCNCTHLTEFHILALQAEDGTSGCVTQDGSVMYLIFAILYSILAIIALMQLIRSAFKARLRTWLLLVVFTALLCTTVTRAVNQAMLYRPPSDLTLSQRLLLSGLPFVFEHWVFAGIIATWAIVLEARAKVVATSAAELFQSKRSQFFVGNGIVSIVILAVTCSMTDAGAASDYDRLNRLSNTATGIAAVIQLVLAATFSLYGGRLFLSLVQPGVPLAGFVQRLGYFVCLLVMITVSSAAVLLQSVLYPVMYDRYQLQYDGTYFALDVLALSLVNLMLAHPSSRSALSNGSSTGASAIVLVAAQRQLCSAGCEYR